MHRWMSKQSKYEEAKIRVEAKGCKLLSKSYGNMHSKLDIECPKGHLFKRDLHCFTYGKYQCPKCYYESLSQQMHLTHDFVKREIEIGGHKLLSKEYEDAQTPLQVECPKGHIYKTYRNRFQQGTRCPKCAIIINTERKRLTHKQVRELIEAEGFRLLSKEYKDAHTNLLIECLRGHQYVTIWNSFQQGYHCARCNLSKGEETLFRVLTTLYPQQEIIRQKRVGRFKLDFYLPVLNTAIEYDGEQHFRPVRFRGISKKKAKEVFNQVQERDQKKSVLCKLKGIRVVHIPYHYFESRTLRVFTDRVRERLGKEMCSV